MIFVRECIDMELIRFHDSLRSKLTKKYKPCVFALLTMGETMKLLRSDIDEECKETLIKGCIGLQ